MLHTTPQSPVRLCAFTLGLAFALTPSATASTAGSDWPGFRGPNGNGQVTTRVPGERAALELRVTWKQPIGSGYSGLAVAGDTAVTAAASTEHDVVQALSIKTGERLWSVDLDQKTVGLAGSKDGPISTPAVGGGRVFMISTQGKLLALDLANGERLWSVHLVEDLGSVRPSYGFATSPVVVGDMVVVQSGGAQGAMAGLDATTGALRWRAFTDGHYAQSPVVTTLAGREQVVAIGALKVVGLDPLTGAELWNHEHGGAGEFGADSSSPLPIGNDRLFLKHDNERTKVLQIGLREDETFTTEVLSESRTLTRSYAPPTVWGDSAFGFTSRFLSALDLTSGTELWRSRAPGDGFLLAVDGLLFVANKKQGTGHLGLASTEGWTELDNVPLFEDLVWTPPSFADGALIVRSLTEVARVDIVQGARQTSNPTAKALPPELESLTQQIAGGADADAAIQSLLAGLNGPLVRGDRALFLWRGKAEEVGIAGDMFGFRYDESMQRLSGTDLWWHELTLDRRGRFNYVYFPDYRPTVDPLNPQTVESTVMGPDLNHRADDVLQMSWFAMPDWPGLTVARPGAHEQSGRLERFDVIVTMPARSSEAPQAMEVTVPVTVWLPPGYDKDDRSYPIVLALERYAEPLGNWPAALDSVVGDRARPLIGVMMDAPEGFYGRRGGGRVSLLVPEVLAQLDQKYRTIPGPSGRAVVGALYTAPPALAMSFGEERLFARVAVQSPFALDVMLPMHRQQIARAENAEPPEAFYFEWARWDMRSPLEGLVLGEAMREVYQLYVDAGYHVLGGEVWDSTDWSGWRNRTGMILEALFPANKSTDPKGPPAALERWLVEPPR